MWRLADRRIDTFVDRGACEFIGEYARPFSMLVIADLLGVPEDDQVRLRILFDQAGAPGKVGQELPANPIAFLDDLFLEYVLDRRARPRDDVLTKLATNTFADGRLPLPMEAVNVATILFAGGQGTVARFLGNMVRHLAEHPETQLQLRDDRSLIPLFVDEMLRYDSPVKLNQRLARRTTTVGGVAIPAGSTVLLLLPAGDRDPRHFECPAEFDPLRQNLREHVAFGRGIHSCPGAPLVRADAKITLERILDRMAEIRISDAHHGPPGARRYEYTNTYILRGVDALHIEFNSVKGEPRRTARGVLASRRGAAPTGRATPVTSTEVQRKGDVAEAADARSPYISGLGVGGDEPVAISERWMQAGAAPLPPGAPLNAVVRARPFWVIFRVERTSRSRSPIVVRIDGGLARVHHHEGGLHVKEVQVRGGRGRDDTGCGRDGCAGCRQCSVGWEWEEDTPHHRGLRATG
jgi:hypothetical protein